MRDVRLLLFAVDCSAELRFFKLSGGVMVTVI